MSKEFLNVYYRKNWRPLVYKKKLAKSGRKEEENIFLL
jgi:hypothetical protein